MRLLLDNGPLGHLAEVMHDQWSWKAGTLHVSDIVARERATGALTRRLLEACDAAGERWITQHALVLGSPAERMYTGRLRSRYGQATKTSGEAASIALLAHGLEDGVLVTMDAKAAFIALVELGPGRVISPFDCWRWLLEEGCIEAATRASLDERTSETMSVAGVPGRLR